MKILGTVKWVQARGGAERVGLDAMSGLRVRGNAVTVMYLSGEDLLPSYRRAGCKMRRAHDFFLDRQRPAPSLIGLTRSAFAGIREAPDLVYTQAFEHLTFGATVAAATRSGLICHLHLPPPPEPFARQFRRAFPRVGRFIAVSDDVRNRFGEAGLPIERIDVVHNGIDLSKFSPGTSEDRQKARAQLGLEEDDYAVVYVGRIDHVKGIDVLIEAANRLAVKHRNARLLVVGQPIWRESEEEGARYIKELGELAREVRIDFLGPHFDLVPFYRAADVVVVPSVWPEPFGLVVVEAMACGKPVAASRIGGIPEILSGELSEFLFTPGDPVGLADLLERIYEQRATDLGHTFRSAAVARFGIDTMIDGISASIDNARTPSATVD